MIQTYKRNWKKEYTTWQKVSVGFQRNGMEKQQFLLLIQWTDGDFFWTYVNAVESQKRALRDLSWVAYANRNRQVLKWIWNVCSEQET